MSTARFIATTGIAWITSLTLTVVLLLGIHHLLSREEARAAAGRATEELVATAQRDGPPRGLPLQRTGSR